MNNLVDFTCLISMKGYMYLIKLSVQVRNLSACIIFLIIGIKTSVHTFYCVLSVVWLSHHFKTCCKFSIPLTLFQRQHFSYTRVITTWPLYFSCHVQFFSVIKCFTLLYFRHHKKAVRQVSFHKRYPLFASASDDGTVIVCHGMVYR
jgi:hypothetical protein